MEGLSMSGYFWQFIIAMVIYLALDVAWLSTAGRSIYFVELAGILKDRPNFPVALVFYCIFVVGLLSFVIRPAIEANDVWQAAKMGAFFGCVAYATYDLTNLASMKGFTARIALIDLAWGTFLSASVCSLTVLVLRWFKLG
jgi:uncharacterized membrane protein